MTRKRKQKSARDLRAHAFKRSVQRCGEPIDIDDAVAQIKGATDRAWFVHRESLSRTHWLVQQEGKWLHVVYNTRIGMIATVLGPAAAPENKA